ncbi:hypothetical protein B0T19DRAFT_478693 [Cercophora scortea]|uniref:DUF7932 domain-containing protein n=1 Tax=Cercophora scortea TaxID=314031 RepID=A0AAE0I6P2_9PEZI|nr:hypothetical protein B0T19DRAFT_478693 [Cercophora scortea]
MTMAQGNFKIIDTSGQDGNPAVEFFNRRPAEAFAGCNGIHGRSAGSATAGTPGSDIRIRVGYSDAEPGLVQVTGEGAHTGRLWKIDRGEQLLLKASGGKGGNGGRGENGQAGGPGRPGRDASKYRAGEDGEDGGRGGDAGAGSDGADGAPGGNVYLTVHDDDTDLLLPLAYNVSGGQGGLSGDHGMPGEGGRGGRGGDSYAWSHGDRSGSMPGGRNGDNGPAGNPASRYLSAGRSAPHGSVQIRVIRGDLSEATYPGPYTLELVHFDVVDENHDGINEPGEHVLVHNIRVRNRGGMPTPSTRSIQLLIQGTQWLDPVMTEPVQVPFSIQAGQEVTVPGVLRALIRNEWTEKPVGTPLRVQQTLSLVAVFNERLNRPIPNFSAGVPLNIRYPLSLDAPTYLDCVAKGDKVRFKWAVHNDSSLAYGSDTQLRRACGTKLSDPQRFFALTYATAEQPDEAVDELDEAEPFSIVTIEQEFSVNDHVMEFSDGFLTLELLLADPRTGQMRSIQKHQMRMQISGVYHLSPDPSVLLVVNASTPNHAIHQIIELLRNRLHTKLDIFNLGLTGSYESPVTKRNVLASYTGRTVVVFANAFTYFGGEVRNPWDLLDAWETALLLKQGTSLLFANVADTCLQSLQDWARQATFPLPDLSSGGGGGGGDGQVAPSAKAAAVALRQAGPAAVATPSESESESESWGVPLRYPVSASLFGGIESAAVGSATAAAKTLTKQMPLRRFVAFPGPEVEAKAKAGTVVVFEGVPRTAKMLATVGYFGPSSPPNTNRIADYDMYFILSCLPFALRARMFWNAVGRLASCEASVLYAGVEGYLDLPMHAAPDSLLAVDDKVLQAIGLSLQFDLCDEIYCFTGTRPRFPDPIPVPEKLAQMPLTSLFFSLVPQLPQVTDVAQAQRLVSALGAVHALANPLSFWQWVKGSFSCCCGNRKGQLTAKLNEQILLAVDRACAAPDVAAAVRQAVMQRSVQVKAGIRASRGGGGSHKSFDRFGQTEVAAFASVSGVMVHDLTALQPVSTSMNKTQVDQHRHNHWAKQHMVGTLKTHAETQLKEMVNAEDAGDTEGAH